MLGIQQRTANEVQEPVIRLLIDQNLSHKLAYSLSDLFPDSQHVRHVLSRTAPDPLIHTYAGTHGFTILTKNGLDFIRLATARGHPPKTIIVRLGNCTTSAVEALMRDNFETIRDFVGHSQNPVLELPQPTTVPN